MRIEIRNASGETERELEAFPISIGRGVDADLRVDEARVSRRHATLENREGRIFAVDLGSTNGIRVNGERVECKRLRTGDEISVGETTIKVLELPRRVEPIRDVAVDAATLSRSRRRALATTVIPVLLALAAFGGLAWWLVYQDRENDRSVGQDAGAPSAFDQRLTSLENRLWRSPTVSRELFADARRLKETSRGLGAEQRRRLDELIETLEARRRIDAHNELFELMTRRRELVEAKRYGELLAFLASIREERRGADAEVRARVQDLLDSSRKIVDDAYRDFTESVRFIELPEYREECFEAYAIALDEFAGTDHEASITERRARFEQMLARVEAQKQHAREEMAARLDELLENEEPVARVRKREPTIFDLVAEPIRAGALAERSYLFGKRRGKPVDLVADGLVVVMSDGQATIALGELELPRVLEMAGDCLTGKKLVSAATFGFRGGHAHEAGALLARYVGEKGASRDERTREVEELLVTVRGLDAKPEGGFTWDREHGWEDRGERENRLAVVEATRLAKKLTPISSAKSLRTNFDRVLAIHDRPGMTSASRRSIREGVVARLDIVREKLVSDVEKLSKKLGLSRLRAAKQELNARRAAALDVIYDSKIYLPEDHPDWSKGDQVNGQSRVDELVRAVRELWDDPAKFTVTLSASARKKLDTLKMLQDEFYKRLHASSRQKEDPLEDLWTNLADAIDLRSFSLNGAERGAWEFNRKVEKYHAELDDPDVSESDKAHVKVVNDYREMMGRRRLFIDARICRAARKHSGACDRAGRIWHNGPDGTPSSRARAEGFPGGVGENVAIGYPNPEGTWTIGWYRASDHHRNGLANGWSCIGYGYVGRVGTQNFGRIGAPFH